MENKKIYTLEEIKKAREEFENVNKVLKEFEARGGEATQGWENMAEVEGDWRKKKEKYKEIFNATRKPGTPPMA
jgi:hypothetical protein